MLLKSSGIAMSLGILSIGPFSTILNADMPMVTSGLPVWVSALSPIFTVLGTLITVYLAINKMVKDPVDKLHAMQESLVQEKINKQIAEIEDHQKRLATMEIGRVEDREELKGTLYGEIAKLKDANREESDELNQKLGDMQNSITKLDERSDTTNKSITEVNSRLAELSSQLTMILGKIGHDN